MRHQLQGNRVDIVFSVIAIALLIGLFIFVRKRPASEAARPARPATKMSDTGSRFHAVSIRYGSGACDAAREMEGRRFLSSAAPKLPLPGCNAAECRCRFKHHEDRRSGQDRRNVWGQGFGSGTTGQYPKEQRKGRDRRRSSPQDEPS
jgi:hypothetical protein